MAAYRLKVSGLVNTPKSLTIDELKKMGSTELIAGFECSGNRRPLQGLIGNGRWTGVLAQDGARGCRSQTERSRDCVLRR